MKFKSSFFICIFCFLANLIYAQNGSFLSISGELENPLKLTIDDLKAYPKTKQIIKDRDNQTQTFEGVALIDLLKMAGVTTGAKLRGENLTKYLLIQAADGYEVIFSLAEIDPEFTNQIIILAFEKNGLPLSNGEGPFRLIVPNDKKPARWIREVKSIQVKFSQN